MAKAKDSEVVTVKETVVYPARERLTTQLIDAAKEGDVKEILRLRHRTINFYKRDKKNKFGETGVKVDLGVPCGECGFDLFYNDAAGAECMVCGKMHFAK